MPQAFAQKNLRFRIFTFHSCHVFTSGHGSLALHDPPLSCAPCRLPSCGCGLPVPILAQVPGKENGTDDDGHKERPNDPRLREPSACFLPTRAGPPPGRRSESGNAARTYDSCHSRNCSRKRASCRRIIYRIRRSLMPYLRLNSA